MVLVNIVSRLMVGGNNLVFNGLTPGGESEARLEQKLYDSLQPGMDYTIRYQNGDTDKIKKEDIGLFRVRVIDDAEIADDSEPTGTDTVQ